MSFLNARHLPSREDFVGGVSQRGFLGLRTGIPEIAGVEFVVCPELLVKPARGVVLSRNARQRDAEGQFAVAIKRCADRSFRPQFEVGSDSGNRRSALRIGGYVN